MIVHFIFENLQLFFVLFKVDFYHTIYQSVSLPPTIVRELPFLIMAAAFMVYSSASLMQLDGSRLRLGFELVVAQVCSLCIVPCLEGLCVSCGTNLSLDPTNCTSEAEEIGRNQCRRMSP